MNIIRVQDQHVAAILKIYSPYITGSAITFENEIPAIADFERRIKKYTEKFPWLVMMDGETVAGYAYASLYRDRIAYQWAVESSVYVHPGYHQKKVGHQLYTALLELLREQGIYKIYALITIPNEPSITFHEKFGFKWLVTFKNIGYKLGKWHDVSWWELVLQEPVMDPPPPVFYSRLNPTRVDAILNKYII